MSGLQEDLVKAIEGGHLLAISAKNIDQLLQHSSNPLYQASIGELVARNEWTELNDRFFRTLAFGTGGLRGRTIGRVVTQAEQGNRIERPEYPCVGTNAMNFYNVSRATQGLVYYLQDHLGTKMPGSRPSIAIAYDTRYFSRAFAELTADVAIENGCDVFLFQEPRSTPELSFAVRMTNATAGIVITASHNPPHDNGYKVYFSDGAQVVEPHASGIIERVNKVVSEKYEPVAPERRGQLVPLEKDVDEAYKARLRTLILRPDLLASQSNLKVVFTPIHGTGAIISVPLLRESGIQVLTVAEQGTLDGGFPTVSSPNPENVEALTIATQLAEREQADLVLATDPDGDRMGVCCRNREGRMQLLTGNQIGSILAFYRIKTLKQNGVLNQANLNRAVIIKTLVTTDLQKAIAQAEGLRCVETLTGFKYIGEKLGKYEDALPEEFRRQYRALTEEETRALRLQQSSYFVFGGEESFGYSGADFVRDKDANASSLMFTEVAAYAKSEGMTLDELLDEIYLEYGCYLEKNASLNFEGAEGATRIRRLAESYIGETPSQVDGSPVTAAKDFAREEICDVEGDLLPKEKMTIFELNDGRRVAVRPSGTEPKIKFYLSGKINGLDQASLSAAKENLSDSLDRLWSWLQADVERRIA
jgi:phosphoglucomutase